MQQWVNPLVRQFLLAHWLFVPGQNSRVAVTVFYREIHYFRVARNPSKIDAKQRDHCLHRGNLIANSMLARTNASQMNHKAT